MNGPSRRTGRSNPRNGRVATNRQLQSLKAQMDTNLKVRPARTQPTPAMSAGDTWFSYKALLSKTATTSALSFTFGDVIQQLINSTDNPNVVAYVRPRKISVWAGNAGNTNTLIGVINCTFPVNNYTIQTTNSSSNSTLSGRDFGSASSLPGLSLVIPKVASTIVACNSSNQLALVDIATTGTNVTYYAEVFFDFQI
jgi:hypothetical protein